MFNRPLIKLLHRILRISESDKVTEGGKIIEEKETVKIVLQVTGNTVEGELGVLLKK